MKLLFLLLFLEFSVNALQSAGNAGVEMLAKACRMGDLETAETLLSAGVDPNLPNEDGRTPLYYAALFNHNDVAELLLADHANPNLGANSRTRGSASPQTPLQITASMGNLQMASKLVTAGAHVDTKADAGRTALHFAVDGGHLDVIRFLIEKGADVNTRDAQGASPLDDAVWRGYLEETAILLANGARLNEADMKTGATPISEAAYRDETQLIRYLLQFGPNLELRDKRGYTPLENAVRMGKSDSALLLLEAEAKQHKEPQFFEKVMSAAIQKDEAVVVAALLRHGALANGTLASGATPLDAAASAGAAEVVGVLLSGGADPNRSGRDGTNALEDASLRGFEAVAEMLLDHGALVNEVNNTSGTTALYAAASFGKRDIVTLLLKRGADPNVCGKRHVSPYEAAVENGYSEIAADIQRYGGSRACKP